MRRFSLREVLEVCESKAMQHKVKALHEQGQRDRDKMLKANAMGFACMDIADTFQKMAGAASNDPATAEKIDLLARELDPQAFTDYEAMIHRLRQENHDDGYALQKALSIYGDAMEAAREKARDNLANTEEEDQSLSEYTRGIEDAIHWHEIRAREAELQEARETLPARKVKYRQRSERHRLYARKMREDLSEMVQQRARASKMADKNAARQASLPLQESGIPLEIQQAHLRKNEVLDAD